jgi:cation:H+ antiporter
MIWLWGQFVICAGLIVGAGVFLVKFGDAIAERTGLGRLWAGAILVATATSLPELFTGVSSVLIFDAPDIAVGTLLGSCVVNLLILVALDAMCGRRSFFDGVEPAYLVEAGLALGLTALAALGLYLADAMRGFPWAWPGSLLVPVVYVFGVRVTMREGRYPPFVQDLETYRAPTPTSTPARASPKRLPALKMAVAGYAGAAAVVIAASLWLPGVAQGIAEATGIGTTVVGGVLVALTTSLPEIVTTLAAFRIGAADMAFSNVIGSNLFNLVVLAIDDFLFARGPITSHASPAQLGTAVIAMGMTAVVVVALAVRKQRKVLGLSWASWVLVAAFVANVAVISLPPSG